jgi:hypothetical protein
MNDGPPNVDYGTEFSTTTPITTTEEYKDKDKESGASRSRRPTYIAPESVPEDKKIEELIVPEDVAPKWTFKRVVLVSWNYVTTVKVSSCPT